MRALSLADEARLTYCPSPTRGPRARRPATPTSADPLPSLAPPHVPGPASPLRSAPPLMTRARRSPQRCPPRLIKLRRRPTRSSLRTPVVTGNFSTGSTMQLGIAMNKLKSTAKEDGYNFQCEQCDIEVVQSMTELLLRGLATASVDSTTGDMFKSASSVAVCVKAEMEGYLFRRTEMLVREYVDGPEGNSDQLMKASTKPIEFLSYLIDDFVASKRNMLSHVSVFLSNESRLNKIKDFTQKMQMENIWALDERKATAETILESIDLECIFHCPERFAEQDKLVEHRSRCKFRVVKCKNDGCSDSFSAIHIEEHDSICPFKAIPCEQLCEEHVMRCEMDKHCATVCLMKIINCPFHHVGCERAFPQGILDRHCSELFQTHLLYVLQTTTRHGALVNDMNQRLQLLEKAQSLNELSGALDIRSLTLTIKEQESRIKKLEHDIKMQDAKMKKLENEIKSGKA